MQIEHKIKISNYEVFYLLVLIGFLFPRGFSEISETYHRISSLLVWLSVLMIWVQYFLTLKWEHLIISKKHILFSMYFVGAIIITMFNRSEITNGFQQMFAYPSLCVFVILNMKKRPKQLLNVMIDIWITVFTLNLFTFREYFEDRVHLTFLGHVQVISQIGMLGIFISCLYWMLYKEHKKKIIYLLLIILITMFTTDADSAVFSAIILLSIGIVYRWKLYHLFSLNTRWYIAGMFMLNIFTVYITAVNNILANIIQNLSFSGRKYVWQNALFQIFQKPITGYGIEGVLLETFWTEWTGGGFNYAHNQIMQNLIDGGIVLLVLFWTMLFSAVSDVNKIIEKKYRILINAVMITLMFVMIFDSTTSYCYMFIILSIIYSLPNILIK